MDYNKFDWNNTFLNSDEVRGWGSDASARDTVRNILRRETVRMRLE